MKTTRKPTRFVARDDNIVELRDRQYNMVSDLVIGTDQMIDDDVKHLTNVKNLCIMTRISPHLTHRHFTNITKLVLGCDWLCGRSNAMKGIIIDDLCHFKQLQELRLLEGVTVTKNTLVGLKKLTKLSILSYAHPSILHSLPSLSKKLQHLEIEHSGKLTHEQLTSLAKLETILLSDFEHLDENSFNAQALPKLKSIRFLSDEAPYSNRLRALRPELLIDSYDL